MVSARELRAWSDYLQPEPYLLFNPINNLERNMEHEPEQNEDGRNEVTSEPHIGKHLLKAAIFGFLVFLGFL
ncbi:MAG TPA: hypothetical protein VK612_10260, partial [Pyrinomonadaceae bacterium]|nr:hypothetical protein [Pyrinomonadaceae bacterium]